MKIITTLTCWLRGHDVWPVGQVYGGGLGESWHQCQRCGYRTTLKHPVRVPR